MNLFIGLLLACLCAALVTWQVVSFLRLAGVL
jgi:hypothetical protein